MKIRLLTIIVLFLMTSTAWAIDRGEAVATFHEANAAYKSGKYDVSVDLYQSIIDGGWDNAAIYYNLGNSYFKQEDLGRAILNYERALRLAPRDGDVQKNLKFAQSWVTNFEEEKMPAWATMAPHSQHVSQNEILWMLLGFVVIGGLIYLCGLFFHYKPYKVYLSLGIIVLLIIFHIYALNVRRYMDFHRAIVLEETDAKYEPADDATTYFQLTTGLKTRVIKVQSDWTKVQRPDGKIGWVKSEAIERI